MIDRTALVVVLKKHRAPAVFRGRLRIRKAFFEVCQLPVPGLAPVGLVRQINIDMAELKDHVKDAVFSDPQRQLAC